MREYTEEADFIIIDDDPLGTLITKRIINLSLPKATVITFANWKPAIEYFSRVIAGFPCTKAYMVFLEIHMEFGSGWEFLEAFQNMDAAIRKKVNISILSTILSDKDLLRANMYTVINKFIEKPLSSAKFNDVISDTVCIRK